MGYPYDFDSPSGPVTRDELLRFLRGTIPDRRTVEAMAAVPRDQFVDPELRPFAWENRPLPIGHGQTISQPEIVGAMTAALRLSGRERVLEVGSGSGYQAAVLAELAREVVTVERIPELVARAAAILARLGYVNVEVRQAGEILGYPEGGPYEAILVAAAAPEAPEALLGQLAAGGRLVIPVGSRHEQTLMRITKGTDGRTIREDLGPCRFVPLIGRGAWP